MGSVDMVIYVNLIIWWVVDEICHGKMDMMHHQDVVIQGSDMMTDVKTKSHSVEANGKCCHH